MTIWIENPPHPRVAHAAIARLKRQMPLRQRVIIWAMERVIVEGRSAGHSPAKRLAVKLTRYNASSWYTRLSIGGAGYEEPAKGLIELDPDALRELGRAALKMADESDAARRRSHRSHRAKATSKTTSTAVT